MGKMISTILLLAVALASLVACVARPTRATTDVNVLDVLTFHPPNLEYTSRQASIIAVGKATSVTGGVYRESDGRYIPTADYTFTLTEILKGDDRSSITIRIQVPPTIDGLGTDLDTVSYDTVDQARKVADELAENSPGYRGVEGTMDRNALLFIVPHGSDFTLESSYPRNELAREEIVLWNRGWAPATDKSQASGVSDMGFHWGYSSGADVAGRGDGTVTLAELRALVE